MNKEDIMQKNYHIKMLKKEIEKGSIFPLFKKPVEQETLKHTTKRFPINWCVHDGIRNNFGDRWWMVFDAPPYNYH